MKVIVYGNGTAPQTVRAVQTEQLSSERELRDAAVRLSGGAFAIVILTSASEIVALSAAKLAHPKAKVVLAARSGLKEVVRPGQYRPYAMNS